MDNQFHVILIRILKISCHDVSVTAGRLLQKLAPPRRAITGLWGCKPRLGDPRLVSWFCCQPKAENNTIFYCMYIYIHICVHAHIIVYIVFIYTHFCVYRCCYMYMILFCKYIIYIYIYLCIYVNIYIYSYLPTCKHVYKYIYIYRLGQS